LGVWSLLPMRAAPDPRPQRKRSLLVGMLHGASGTAALTLLVATTIPVRIHALAFVVVFGLASVLGMTAAAAALAWPLASAPRRTSSGCPSLRGSHGS